MSLEAIGARMNRMTAEELAFVLRLNLSNLWLRHPEFRDRLIATTEESFALAALVKTGTKETEA